MATDESNLDVVEPIPPPVPGESPKPRKPAKSRPPKKGRPPKKEAPPVPPKSEKPAQISDPEPPPSKPFDQDDVDRKSSGGLFRGMSATMGSTVFHLVFFIFLGLMTLPSAIDLRPSELVVDMYPEMEDEIETMELQEQIEAASQVSVFGVAEGPVGEIGDAVGVEKVELNQKVVQNVADGPDIQIKAPLSDAPSFERMMVEAPEGMLGDARAVVDSLAEAMDRIAKEILWHLDKSDVLVVWAFDQSESMKLDQKEIRSRIDRVYLELGLHRKSSGQRLTTAVTSYGAGFLVHTQRPTSEIPKIRAAIDTVPNDPSGKEMMCSAVTMSIAGYQEYAKKQKRQMMLILVTDETGEKPDNLANLENAIAVAKQSRCKVYVLGREAVFGYPYAHMKWRHPQTGHIHWIPVDRGPETAFVEQLQTECFRKRTDAHPSGFGPYGQTRLARESGGIYFMLPSLESDIVRGEKRRYELEAMRSYKPDLRHRGELEMERNASILRSMLWKIINDLNPYDKKVAEAMLVSFRFSAKEPQFVAQVRTEQAKAMMYINYLDAAAKALEQIRKYREQEVSPRWQANYDIIYAQVLAYTARTYEYGAYLEHFINNPKVVPYEKPGFIRLSSWHLRESKKTVGGELTDSYIARSAEMFNRVIKEHAGTPWAARAEWELARGFGVQLQEHYSYYGPRPPTPPRPHTPSVPRIPVPKF